MVGSKRYCDDCHSDDAQRFYDGWVVRDYCINCAIKRKLFKL
jgi:hypothetical protein